MLRNSIAQCIRLNLNNDYLHLVVCYHGCITRKAFYVTLIETLHKPFQTWGAMKFDDGLWTILRHASIWRLFNHITLSIVNECPYIER